MVEYSKDFMWPKVRYEVRNGIRSKQLYERYFGCDYKYNKSKYLEESFKIVCDSISSSSEYDYLYFEFHDNAWNGCDSIMNSDMTNLIHVIKYDAFKDSSVLVVIEPEIYEKVSYSRYIACKYFVGR